MGPRYLNTRGGTGGGEEGGRNNEEEEEEEEEEEASRGKTRGGGGSRRSRGGVVRRVVVVVIVGGGRRRRWRGRGCDEEGVARMWLIEMSRQVGRGEETKYARGELGAQRSEAEEAATQHHDQ